MSPGGKSFQNPKLNKVRAIVSVYGCEKEAGDDITVQSQWCNYTDSFYLVEEKIIVVKSIFAQSPGSREAEDQPAAIKGSSGLVHQGGDKKLV